LDSTVALFWLAIAALLLLLLAVRSFAAIERADRVHKAIELVLALVLGVGQLLLGYLGYQILQVQETISERQASLLASQNRILGSQTKLTETQAITSLIASMDLEKDLGNDLKLAQIAQFDRTGYRSMAHKALLNFAESEDTNPRLRLGAFRALFAGRDRHDAIQVRSILWAFCWPIYREYRWDDPPDLYQVGVPYLGGKDLDSLLPLAGEFAGYLEYTTERMKGNAEFREAVRQDIAANPDFVGGLAILHEAIIRENDRLTRDYERKYPPRKYIGLPTHILWHVSIFDFARGMNGAFSYDVLRHIQGRWLELPSLLKAGKNVFDRDRILIAEIAKWFNVRSPRPRPTSSPKPTQPTTTPTPSPTPYRPSPGIVHPSGGSLSASPERGQS
jgi:hypothetical protein